MLLILCFSNFSDVLSWVLNCHCFLSTLGIDAKWTSRSLCFLPFTQKSYFGYSFDVSNFDASVGQLRTGQRIFFLSFLFLASLWRISAPFFLVLLLFFFLMSSLCGTCMWVFPIGLWLRIWQGSMITTLHLQYILIFCSLPLSPYAFLFLVSLFVNSHIVVNWSDIKKNVKKIKKVKKVQKKNSWC